VTHDVDDVRLTVHILAQLLSAVVDHLGRPEHHGVEEQGEGGEDGHHPDCAGVGEDTLTLQGSVDHCT